MLKKPKLDNDRHFKSVMMAYLILVLHVFLIVGLVILVIFLHGLINYMLWIFIGGSAAILASGYHFYKRMQKEGKTLREIMGSPWFRGRSVEVSVLGGLVTLKIGKPENMPLLSSDLQGLHRQQLEDPEKIRIRELSELVKMLENNMISLEEYNNIKQQIFKS